MGDGALAKLDHMLDERGITLLVLDWTDAPLPRLAVLLAAAQASVIQWCSAHAPSVASAIDLTLTAVQSDTAFVSTRDQLREDASAGYVGLSALAEMNRTWCGRVFSEPTASRQAFGQYLTVMDSTRPAIVRPPLDAEIEALLSTTPQSPRCIAVLGPEGAGKSWLVTRWWAAAVDKPILIICAAHSVDLIEPKDPLKTLANLIAAQGSGDFDDLSKRWLRRLHRWHDDADSSATAHPKFLVIFDGLNERSGMHWADSIFRISLAISKLGGHLVLTCRERFWDRDVAPRLAGVAVMQIRVGDYTQAELNELLRQRRIPIADIPDRIRSFIRNPRICSIAVDLLDRLSASADELTIERLLLEYWRRRLEERGDLISHNVRDFENLLKSHAKALRENPGVQFDRDDWREHSGAARRGDGRSVENDLTEIEEGAFLQIVEGQDGYYEFKPDTVPFALGLLVARELQAELRKPNRNPAEVIDSIVEEVQGFDLVSEALRAAAGIACFEANYPSKGRASLISAWLDLQNVPDSGYEALAAYVAACPEAALDAVETAFDQGANGRRRQWLLEALLQKRDRPNVIAALTPRINKWLALWSRIPRRIGGAQDEREETRLAKHAAQIVDRLNRLTPAEQNFLATTCQEVNSPATTQLDATAVLLIAGQPQAAYAEAVLAWAFASVVADDFQRAYAELGWAVRLNTKDFFVFEQRLRGIIGALLNSSISEVGREAVATALRTLGTVAASNEAERLHPLEKSRMWRRVENYCATDPFDPGSEYPTNLANAIREADTIEPTKVWNFMGPGEKDLELSWITPGLARFEPDAIISLLREIASTADKRSNLSLRQLSWRLQELSPLFDSGTLAAVLTGYRRLIQHPNLVDADDQHLVTGSILVSILPHFPAQEQLQLYLELPDQVGDWYSFRDVFAPLSAAELEMALTVAERDAVRLRRTLFFVSAHRPPLTARSRGVLVRALEHIDPLVVTCASDVAYVARDTQLDEAVISAARRRVEGANENDKTFWRDRAVAVAVVSMKRLSDLPLIAPRFVGFAARQLGTNLDDRIATEIDRNIDRLLSPIQASEPQMGRIYLDAGLHGHEVHYRVEDRAEEDADQSIDNLKAWARRYARGRQGMDEYAKRREALQEEADAYLRQLEREGAQALADEPDVPALKCIATNYPEQVRKWASRILAETDEARLATVRNLGLGVAQALADVDADISATLFVRLMDLQSPVTITVGNARIPIKIAALFSGPDVEPLSALRARALGNAMTDADLEAIVFAANTGGLSCWLQNWIERQVTSGIPGCVARGLAVEGLRNHESEYASALLSRNWGSGFLGLVADHARFAFDRNVWARTWAVRASSTSDPLEFWRFGELAVGIADVRALHWFDPDLDTAMMCRYGRDFFNRIRKAAENRTRKRADTLFGLKKPNQALSALLVQGFA